jgi:hypothetical protein
MNYYQLLTAVQDYTENQFPQTYLADGTTVSPTQQINRMIEQAELRIYNSVLIPSLRKNVTGSVSSTNPYLSAPADYLSTFSLAVIDSTGNYTYLLDKDVNFIRQSYPNPTYRGLPRYYALFGPQFSNPNDLSFIIGPTPDQNYTMELHYYYYPVSIIQSAVASLGPITNPGSGYVTGVYDNVAATGGSGDGLLLNITTSGGIVTSCTISYAGSGYTPGDVITATIGSTGSGFATTVGTVNNPSGTSWIGDNFDTVLLYGTLVEAATYMKQEQDLVALYNTKYQEAMEQLNRLGTGLERSDMYRNGQPRIKVNQ